MIFFKFVRACIKYGFTFTFSSYMSLKLVLRPNDTFKNIELIEEYPYYKKLFKKGIKTMKEYRK